MAALLLDEIGVQFVPRIKIGNEEEAVEKRVDMMAVRRMAQR